MKGVVCCSCGCGLGADVEPRELLGGTGISRACTTHLKWRCCCSLVPTQQEEELTEAEKAFKAERGGGNYGAGTKEMQVRCFGCCCARWPSECACWCAG